MDRVRAGSLLLAALVGGGLAWGLLRTSTEARLERARQLSYDRRPRQAAAEFRSILAGLDPAGSESVRRARTEALSRLGDIRYLELGDAAGGAESYRELIAEAPASDEAWSAREKLAQIAQRRGDLGEAIVQWQGLAGSGRPGAADFGYEIARAHMQLGQHEQARTEAKALVDGGVRVEDALALIGTSFQLESRHEEAVAAFDELLRRSPGSEAAARAQYQIGQSRSALRDYEGAMAALVSSLADHPDPWRVQAEIARVRKHLAEEKRILGSVGSR